MKVLLIIPAYNEAENIASVVDNIIKNYPQYDYLVVNDGSMDETEKIMNAQRARGVDFGEGNLIQKMQAIIPLLIPLFVSSFNRAEDLAVAMEARGYQGGEGRSKYRVLNWSLKDTLTIITFAVLTMLLVYLRN